MQRITKLLAVLLCLLACTAAHAQKSKSTLNTEIATQLPDNTVNAITPAIMRSVLTDMVASWLDANGASSLSCGANNFVTGFPTLSTISCAQPTVGNLAAISADQYVGTGSGTTPTGISWLSCSGNNHALQYNTGTHVQVCVTDVANLDVADQTVTGGANVTTQSLTTGNVTIDCGARPLQSITNGGAFTITAPANDGSCILLITNNASAGAVTFSGFSDGAANTGDGITTTNTSKFTVSIIRVGGTSSHVVHANQ